MIQRDTERVCVCARVFVGEGGRESYSKRGEKRRKNKRTGNERVAIQARKEKAISEQGRHGCFDSAQLAGSACKLSYHTVRSCDYHNVSRRNHFDAETYSLC